jgi:hypothetical protein
MKFRANARPRTVGQINEYLQSNDVDAKVIAPRVGYYRFVGGDPPGQWFYRDLLGFSLDGMTFGDWFRAYRDMYAAHEKFHRKRFSRPRGAGFEAHSTKWTAKLLNRQSSTARGRAKIRRIMSTQVGYERLARPRRKAG